MKRHILTISLITFMVTGLAAQNEQDVLRYSFIQTGGTTRSLSMGGALGAVGGDFSTLSINPAGLGIYRSGEFALTTDYSSFSSTADFLGNSRKDNAYKMGISHFGLVIPLGTNNENSGIKGLTFGVGYNKLKDYGQEIYMKGTNNSSSLVDEFVASANNTKGNWDHFSDGLAWETYLIDYDSVLGRYYSDFDYANYGQMQKRTVSTRGSLGEYDFSLGLNLSDKLYFGATLGVQHVYYSEDWVHTEADENNVIGYFDSFTYRNKLKTTGNGVNLKLGLLARPSEFLRIGASVQTPTALKLHDNFTSYMTAVLDDGLITNNSDYNGEFDYTITTPFKATGSVAFIYKQYGLISLDYEFVDYSTGKLSTSEGASTFDDANDAVSLRYKATSNIRVGAELRLLSNYYVRGGYAFYGSPYVSDEPNANNNLNTFSAGLGYRDENYYIDLGFSHSDMNQYYYLYGNTSANVANCLTRFSATIGFKF